MYFQGGLLSRIITRERISIRAEMKDKKTAGCDIREYDRRFAFSRRVVDSRHKSYEIHIPESPVYTH